MPCTSSEPADGKWPAKCRDGQGYRVLFVNPPSSPAAHVTDVLARRKMPHRHALAMPMGVLYLASVLKRARPGIDVRVLDLACAFANYTARAGFPPTTVWGFTEVVVEDTLPNDYVPDFVGVSMLFSTAHRTAVEAAWVLARRWPDAPIVAGGTHATNAVASLLGADGPIDFVCRGEGESIITALADLCHARRPAVELEALPGIVGRAGGRAEHDRDLPIAPLVEDLDSIPYPAWDCIDMDTYVERPHRLRPLDGAEPVRTATLVTTRGCPFQCTFCASWTTHGRKVRCRSVDNVVEELRQLRERWQINAVVPEDDLFTVRKRRILELCRAVTEAFGRNLEFQFPNGLSVATLDRDVLAALAKMGMDHANIAIESGSAYVQKHIIKKNCNLDRARDVVLACRELGVVVRTYFLVGFPGETVPQIEETIEYASSLGADWNVLNIACALPGTEMYDQLLERGDIDTDFSWDDSFFFERTYDTPELSAEALKTLVYDANIRLNFFGNANMSPGRYDRALALFENIVDLYPDHLVGRYCVALAHGGLGNWAAYRATLERCRALLTDPARTMAREQFARYGHHLTGLRAPSAVNERVIAETVL